MIRSYLIACFHVRPDICTDYDGNHTCIEHRVSTEPYMIRSCSMDRFVKRQKHHLDRVSRVNRIALSYCVYVLREKRVKGITFEIDTLLKSTLIIFRIHMYTSNVNFYKVPST